MEQIHLQIGNKIYRVKEAKTEEELEKGLKGVEELSENEGMLFYMPDESTQQIFTMEGMEIPLDIIFINQDQEVISVSYNCQPDQEDIVSTTEYMEDTDYIQYVLEVNPDSGIQVGDSLEFEEDTPVMKVLFPDGSEQMALYGGERIVSRRETKILIKKAKKAQQSEQDSDYKALGRYMFKVIKQQDNRKPEYVENSAK